jgi:vacuolar-type H+-ATPase subunit H
MNEAKVREIKASEEKARSILEEAKKEYSKIIHEAGEEGIALFNSEKSKIKKSHKDTVEKFRSDGEAEAKKILSTLDGELSKISESFKKNKSKAVDYLINEIKVRYGNS